MDWSLSRTGGRKGVPDLGVRLSHTRASANTELRSMRTAGNLSLSGGSNGLGRELAERELHIPV